MQWSLRRALPEDAGAAALIAGASFLETFAGVLPGADIVEHCSKNSSATAFADWIAHPRAIVTLAEHARGAAPVGYTLLTPPDLPVRLDDTDVELRRIYTLSPARGTGLGSALMALAIADAVSLGAGRLLLGVLGANARACDFYERQGFVIAGERRYLVGSSWYDDLVYARAL
jgi:ribosomal protein S18 acetylase RimI-like enzyme